MPVRMPVRLHTTGKRALVVPCGPKDECTCGSK
jgi:hypothetical protein